MSQARKPVFVKGEVVTQSRSEETRDFLRHRRHVVAVYEGSVEEHED